MKDFKEFEKATAFFEFLFLTKIVGHGYDGKVPVRLD
jgi:hypothetical protein